MDNHINSLNNLRASLNLNLLKNKRKIEVNWLEGEKKKRREEMNIKFIVMETSLFHVKLKREY